MILTRRALDGSIALVAGDADTDHGSDGQCVEDLALGVATARVGNRTWVDALLVDAGRLTGTFRIGSAADFN